MCIICEHELWDEHRALEREFFEPCKTCKKFPGTNSDGTCYHCFGFAVGNTIDECPECAGKPWSEEFLEAKDDRRPGRDAGPVLKRTVDWIAPESVRSHSALASG